MLTSIMRSQSSIFSRSSGESGIRPALLMITSMRPCDCTARSTRRLTSARSVTSVRTTASPPSDSSSASF